MLSASDVVSEVYLQTLLLVLVLLVVVVVLAVVVQLLRVHLRSAEVIVK